MDANKELALSDSDYEIRECCVLCQFSSFKTTGEWGTCYKNSYNHLKHSAQSRETSIVKMGRCKHFEAKCKSEILKVLGKYYTFCEIEIPETPASVD